ncbi:MAG: hypothetical protein RLZZ59_662 [Pseudomonadota bacterium]|jgi:hypothetical protein
MLEKITVPKLVLKPINEMDIRIRAFEAHRRLLEDIDLHNEETRVQELLDRFLEMPRNVLVDHHEFLRLDICHLVANHFERPELESFLTSLRMRIDDELFEDTCIKIINSWTHLYGLDCYGFKYYELCNDMLKIELEDPSVLQKHILERLLEKHKENYLPLEQESNIFEDIHNQTTSILAIIFERFPDQNHVLGSALSQYESWYRGEEMPDVYSETLGQIKDVIGFDA